MQSEQRETAAVPKDCPFCGYDAELDEDGFVSCTNVDCPIWHISLSMKEWNSRPEEERLQKQKTVFYCPDCQCGDCLDTRED